MWVAHDDTIIYGLGETAEEAIADAMKDCRGLERLEVHPCTDRLAAAVRQKGRGFAWDDLMPVLDLVGD